MTKENKRLIIFFLLLLFFFLPIILGVKFPCLIKKYFHIACPACGLTRSILAIFKLDFAKSFYFNILGIPIFLTFLITYLLIFLDIIKKENYLSYFWNFLLKHYKIIIILLIVSFIINNFHKI